MCVQKITTGTDCLYLNFLSNCIEDKAYPPLRLYEGENFVFIDAKDGKRVSISKTQFKVKINGVIFQDKSAAVAELEAQILCVNQSKSKGGSGVSGGSTEAKQDAIIVQNTELISQNIELINLSSGANSTTTPANYLTNANSVGVHYTLFSIKCNVAGTMYLKEVETRATTNDQSHICIFKNATIAGAALSYSAMPGQPNIQEGKIPSALSPTGQTVTGGTYIDSFFADKDKLITKKSLNIKVPFQIGDEFVFTATPKSPSLVIEGLCSALFVY